MTGGVDDLQRHVDRRLQARPIGDGDDDAAGVVDRQRRAGGRRLHDRDPTARVDRDHHVAQVRRHGDAARLRLRLCRPRRAENRRGRGVGAAHRHAYRRGSTSAITDDELPGGRARGGDALRQRAATDHRPLRVEPGEVERVAIRVAAAGSVEDHGRAALAERRIRRRHRDRVRVRQPEVEIIHPHDRARVLVRAHEHQAQRDRGTRRQRGHVEGDGLAIVGGVEARIHGPTLLHAQHGARIAAPRGQQRLPEIVDEVHLEHVRERPIRGIQPRLLSAARAVGVRDPGQA